MEWREKVEGVGGDLPVFALILAILLQLVGFAACCRKKKLKKVSPSGSLETMPIFTSPKVPRRGGSLRGMTSSRERIQPVEDVVAETEPSVSPFQSDKDGEESSKPIDTNNTKDGLPLPRRVQVPEQDQEKVEMMKLGMYGSKHDPAYDTLLNVPSEWSEATRTERDVRGKSVHVAWDGPGKEHGNEKKEAHLGAAHIKDSIVIQKKLRKGDPTLTTSLSGEESTANTHTHTAPHPTNLESEQHSSRKI